ncbi:hypothetical protein BDP27DRAFT_1377457 [Rhodocollybia butyracea]|uniref:Uncharacterized protein n=1 Tax=Rhodocollybia butyracea TaxID=206335 RepID=A0A9P5P388_9AGAR|nr:hypothetical protein BDP27DRAFT_1377457 [Rhodocollybia butyracea]
MPSRDFDQLYLQYNHYTPFICHLCLIIPNYTWAVSGMLTVPALLPQNESRERDLLDRLVVGKSLFCTSFKLKPRSLSPKKIKQILKIKCYGWKCFAFLNLGQEWIFFICSGNYTYSLTVSVAAGRFANLLHRVRTRTKPKVQVRGAPRFEPPNPELKHQKQISTTYHPQGVLQYLGC